MARFTRFANGQRSLLCFQKNSCQKFQNSLRLALFMDNLGKIPFPNRVTCGQIIEPKPRVAVPQRLINTMRERRHIRGLPGRYNQKQTNRKMNQIYTASKLQVTCKASCRKRVFTGQNYCGHAFDFVKAILHYTSFAARAERTCE